MDDGKLIETTEEEFFTFVGGPLNIHPNHGLPDVTLWKEVGTRKLIGCSYPGWKNPGEPKRWFLTESAYADLKRRGDRT